MRRRKSTRIGQGAKQELQSSALSSIQKTAARLVATTPAGHNLLLIGGFRYRFLDQSVRTSKDIDYHWSGNLEKKQRELAALFQKRLLPAVRLELGYEGRVDCSGAPGTESPAVRTVTLSFWKPGTEFSRVEIPVEITRVLCADPAEVRTVDGIIYPTPSDTDLIENKITAVFNRRTMVHRDLVDVFLFAGKLSPDSPLRLKRKLRKLSLTGKEIMDCLADLQGHAGYHIKAIQAVIDSQLDQEAAENIRSAGGSGMVLKRVLDVIKANVGLAVGTRK